MPTKKPTNPGNGTPTPHQKTYLREIALDEVVVDPEYNIRYPFDPKHDDDKQLVESMKRDGWRQSEPMTFVPKDKEIHLVAGHRRLAAAIEAGIKKAWALPVAPTTDLTADLLISNSGRPLSFIERGRVYDRLKHADKMPVKEMALISGKSQQHVRDCLLVNDAPEEVHDYIHGGKVTIGAAIDLCRTHRKDPDALIAAIEAEVANTGKAKRKPKETDPAEAEEKALIRERKAEFITRRLNRLNSFRKKLAAGEGEDKLENAVKTFYQIMDAMDGRYDFSESDNGKLVKKWSPDG